MNFWARSSSNCIPPNASANCRIKAASAAITGPSPGFLPYTMWSGETGAGKGAGPAIDEGAMIVDDKRPVENVVQRCFDRWASAGTGFHRRGHHVLDERLARMRIRRYLNRVQPRQRLSVHRDKRLRRQSR